MRNYSIKILFFSLVFLASPLISSAQPNIEEGKTLFKNNCAQCHAKNMKSKATGPALGGVEERWADYPKEDLYEWIRNSQALVQAGHPRGVEIFNEWNKSVMQNFPTLTDENIESLLIYINDVYVNGGKKPVPDGQLAVVETKASTPKWLYWALFAVLLLLAALLSRIISNLDVIAAKKDGYDVEQKTLWQSLTSKGMISFLLFVVVVLGGYTTVNNATSLGRQEGYAPEQPIKFSHATHAGLNKIDCQYCHDGARRSKHSVIPAANTCMNCHRAIKVGSEYGTAN